MISPTNATQVQTNGDWPTIIGAAIFLLVFVPLVIYVERQFKKKRSEGMDAVAQHLGMTFQEDGGTLAKEPPLEFPLFSGSRSNKPRNVLRKVTNDAETILFEFSNWNASTEFPQTAVAFKKGGASLPDFHLSPKDARNRIAGIIGLQDIDLPASPKFSKPYRLQGKDENRIRLLFEGEVARFLLPTRDWTIEGRDEWLLITRHHQRCKPSGLSDFLRETIEVAHTFKFL
jgi:hypothetical protein